MLSLSNSVGYLLSSLPKTFLPRKEKLLLFIYALNGNGFFPEEDLFNEIVCIAQARGVPLDYVFTSTLKSEWLQEDLASLKESGLVEVSEKIGITHDGKIMSDLLVRKSNEARKIFHASSNFITLFKREIPRDQNDYVKKLARQAWMSLLR